MWFVYRVILILSIGGYNATLGRCSGDCYYLYTDLTCSLQGTSPRVVILQCTIYSPCDAIGRVRWYRSDSEGLAGVELVGIREFDSCSQTPLNCSMAYRGLTQVACNLDIRNFTSRDNGYYRCQIEVNNICLSPSPSGHLTFNATHSSYCESESSVGSSLFAMGQPPICATSSSSRCPGNLQPAPSMINVATMLQSSLVPTITLCPDAGLERDSTLRYGIIIGVLVFIISVASAALTLLLVVRHSRRRAIRTKLNGRIRVDDFLELQVLVRHQSSSSNEYLENSNTASTQPADCLPASIPRAGGTQLAIAS